MDTVTDFIFLDSKITMDGDCSQEIQSKAMTNLDSIFKSRDITANKGPVVKNLPSTEGDMGSIPGQETDTQIG